MKTNNRRVASVAVISLLLAVGLAPAKAKRAPATAPSRPSGVEKRLSEFVNLYLPWEPDSKVTVAKSNLNVPGFSSWDATRTGRYEPLKASVTVFVSNDEKWFYGGDVPFQNPNPKPVRSAADLEWVTSRYANVLRANVRAQMAPERDAAGLKGMSVVIETGYF
ncbi:MAG TPA: hypothetical protein VIY96_04350, partial [Thermoanaerobaculia bacterium]